MHTQDAREQEKKKKQKESQDKARTMMANFFSKPKPSPSLTSLSKESSLSPSKKVSDFERTFRSFVIKKGVEMAPINPLRKRRKLDESDVIVISDEDDVKYESDSDIEMVEPPVDLSTMSPRCKLYSRTYEAR